MKKPTRWALIATLLLVIAACGNTTTADTAPPASTSPPAADTSTMGPGASSMPMTTTLPTTTTSSSTTIGASTTTSTTSSPSARIELSAGGLGIVDFGDPADEAVNALTGLLGPPDADDQELGPFEFGMMNGLLANDYLRTAVWDSVGLVVTFTDGAYYRDDGVPHLIAWSVSRHSKLAQTAEGVTVGTPLVDVEAAYPETFFVGEYDVCIGTDFFIESPDGPIFGFLSGPAEDPASTVTGLAAGAWPSC